MNGQGDVRRAMWTCYGRELAYTGLLKLVYDCLLFTTPVILKHLLLSIQHGWAGGCIGLL